MGSLCAGKMVKLRQETHTKAFDAAWVEATLVRQAPVGVTGGMWRTITNFLVGTISHVRVGEALPLLGRHWHRSGARSVTPAFQSPREQRGCGHPSLLSRCPPASLVKSQVRLPIKCR